MSRSRARVLPLLVAVATAGCWASGAPAPPMERPGPILVAEITNRMAADVTFGYEYEAATSAGSGEGVVPACTVMTDTWGQITGDYSLIVGGAVVHEGRLGPGAGDGAHLFVRLRIGPDGEVEVLPPQPRAALPALGPVPIPGC